MGFLDRPRNIVSLIPIALAVAITVRLLVLQAWAAAFLVGVASVAMLWLTLREAKQEQKPLLVMMRDDRAWTLHRIALLAFLLVGAWSLTQGWPWTLALWPFVAGWVYRVRRRALREVAPGDAPSATPDEDAGTEDRAA